MTLYKRIIIKDRDGRITEDTGDQPSHSFNFQFIRLLESFLRNDKTLTAKDVTNTTRILNCPPADSDMTDKTYYWYHVKAGEDDDSYGIVVGTNDTAEANSDYHLVAKIAQGNGTGQLEHGPMSFVTPRINGAYVDYVLIRNYYNNSGGPITSKEFGIYTKKYAASATGRVFCFIRDIDAIGKTVEHGDTMTVQYTLRIGAGFTLNWWLLIGNWFEAPTSGSYVAPYQGIVDVVATPRNSMMAFTTYYVSNFCSTFSLQIDGPDNDPLYGIVIGTGTDAEDLEDTKLQTQINHGVGAGQLDYNATLFVTTEIVAGKVDLILGRSYFNGSPGAIIVKEAAWYAKVRNGNEAVMRYACIIRDNLGGGLQINVGDTGTIQYTLESDVAV